MDRSTRGQLIGEVSCSQCRTGEIDVLESTSLERNDFESLRNDTQNGPATAERAVGMFFAFNNGELQQRQR